VRAEGLIGVGGISTGNLGVVGTANSGPLNTVVVLGSHAEAIETFGPYDAFPDTNQDRALTLTRALEQAFKGGASTVYAVRVANGNPASATWQLQGSTANTLTTLTAKSPGSRGGTIVVKLDSPDAGPATLTLTLGRQKESVSGANVREIVDALASSTMVTASAPANADAAILPKTVVIGDAGGPDGTPATTVELAAGLALLAGEPVNIVVAAGFDAKAAAGTLLAHLESTENDGRERIAVVGASTTVPSTIISDDVSAGSNPRLVLVAPGIVAADAAKTGLNRNTNLPPAYAAALVAGRLSTLAPHVSLTNKDVPADDVTVQYTRAQQKQLLINQVLVLHKNLGIRVLKGITTDTGPFRQISVRRIVDFAKAGVRIGANPYIGRLNNVRVRAALKATLDGFLSGMVLDEMLVGYTLDVTATRSQEINGQAIVTMTLQPTFSIDFVKVIMNLQ
jgi:hypothetical protein